MPFEFKEYQKFSLVKGASLAIQFFTAIILLYLSIHCNIIIYKLLLKQHILVLQFVMSMLQL